MLPSPEPPATFASDSHRIQPQPKDYGPRLGESKSLDNALAPSFAARSTPSLSPLQTSPLRPRESASPSRKKANPVDPAHDRIRSRFDRSESALKSTHATSSIIPIGAASFHNIDTCHSSKQDELYAALTLFRWILPQDRLDSRSSDLRGDRVSGRGLLLPRLGVRSARWDRAASEVILRRIRARARDLS